MGKRPTETQRKAVFERAKGYCEYCLSPETYSNSTFEVEHIIPFSKGGETVFHNLALSCSGCNKYKSHKIEAIDSQSGEKVLLYNPRREIWKKHFKWNADFTQIIGVTPTGRATIQALKLNRKNLLNLRELLRLYGEHPPK